MRNRRSARTSWLAATGPVIVEGSFHRNTAFGGLLAALRPGQPIHLTEDPSGTARGAWLLARWADQPSWPSALPKTYSQTGTRKASPAADANATLTLTKPIFIKMMAGTAGVKDTLMSDELKTGGSTLDLVRFFSLIDKAPGTFPIVTR